MVRSKIARQRTRVDVGNIVTRPQCNANGVPGLAKYLMQCEGLDRGRC
jgi:hypothetical protein